MNKWTAVVKASQMANRNKVTDISHFTNIADVIDINEWTDVMIYCCGGSY
jgi:hypothetical protein